MRRRGQTTAALSILFAFAIYFFGIQFVNFLIPDVDTARTALSCSTPSSLSSGIRILCLFVGGVIPYFIWIIVSVTGGIFLSKLIQ